MSFENVTVILKNVLGLYCGHTDILTHKQKIFCMPKKWKRIYMCTVCTTIKSEIKHTRESYKLLGIKKKSEGWGIQQMQQEDFL